MIGQFKISKISARSALLAANAVLLLVAIVADGLPYGFFSLLRFATCAIFVFAAVKSSTQGERWLFAVGAVAFNPFLPLRLGRELWLLLDVAAVILCAVAIVAALRSSSRHDDD